MKLLLDENLSPRVALILCVEDGIDACHVRDRGGLGIDDRAVMELAYREDRILVTSNVDDFVALARARELHPGIILLEAGDLGRAGQLATIRGAIEAVPDAAEMVNRVLWVAIDGEMSL